MMKFFIYLIFMIPLCLNSMSMLIQYMYMFMYLLFMMFGFSGFYSNISYNFGIDSFSYSLILLSILISSLMVISMMGCEMISMFLLINLFLSFFFFFFFGLMNFFYLYICFEFVLFPLMILILGWGYQPERLMAGMYLFFYTLIASIPLLILLIYMFSEIGSLFFDYMILNSKFFLIHLILLIVFMVKMPMCFFHYWLPKAHVQAPVSGSMILAGLMLKIGGYGLIRICYIYEYMFIKYSYIWFSLSMLGSLMISIICLLQADMKCLIAYSSVSHMGMVIMGFITMNSWGLWGSYFLMLAHGFCSSGLFYMANLFYNRTGSRSFYINKGFMLYMPSCSMLWFLFCSFNMSCPPSLNFISELMILSSMMKFSFISGFWFFGISFFCACFSYYLYSFNQHGIPHSLYSFSSINLIEYLCLIVHLIPLVFMPLVLFSFI